MGAIPRPIGGEPSGASGRSERWEVVGLRTMARNVVLCARIAEYEQTPVPNADEGKRS